MLNLGVIILAGGLSSRMGYPKALLPWVNGESLISHALRNALDHDAKDVLISIGDDEALGQAVQANIIDTLSNEEKNKVSIVRDSVERCGPLGGLYSALSVGKSHAYAVLAVDMPFMDFNLYYDWLYRVEGDDWSVIVPTGESGRYEPMAGIYKPSIAPLLQTALAGEDVSLQHALHIVGSVITIDAVDYSHNLRNVNHIEDYLWARAEAVNACRYVPIISVVSEKRKTGKTTVVTRLVSELQKIGVSVGVVKSDKHGFHMDYEGTDTDLAMKAGATAVAIAGPTETAVRIRTKEQSNLYDLTQTLPVDLVILETRSQGVFPIIEIIRDGYTESLISSEIERVMTVDVTKLDECIPELVCRIQGMMRDIDESRYC